MYIVRHVPTASDFGNTGDPNKITAKTRQISDLRARRFMDVPVRQIYTAPSDRATLAANDIHKYTGAPVTSHWDLSPWYMGPDLTSKGNYTPADVKMIHEYMTTKKAVPIPGGSSYLFFLTILLPFIRSLRNEDELVCVTHRSDITAILAWDAAGREGLAQDEKVLKDFNTINKIQVLELTPDSCVPLVVEDLARVPKVI